MILAHLKKEYNKIVAIMQLRMQRIKEKIKKNEKLCFGVYPTKCPLLRWNKETPGTNEPPCHKFFEDWFIEDIFYEIISSIRGVEAWSTNEFLNT